VTTDSLLNPTMIAKTILVLGLVTGVLLLLAWLIRKSGVFGGGVRAAGRTRRLALIEVRPIDGQRKLVLVRRDDVEHLLMIGGNRDLVVEAGIPAGGEPDDDDHLTFRESRVSPKSRILRIDSEDGDIR